MEVLSVQFLPFNHYFLPECHHAIMCSLLNINSIFSLPTICQLPNTIVTCCILLEGPGTYLVVPYKKTPNHWKLGSECSLLKF